MNVVLFTLLATLSFLNSVLAQSQPYGYTKEELIELQHYIEHAIDGNPSNTLTKKAPNTNLMRSDKTPPRTAPTVPPNIKKMPNKA